MNEMCERCGAEVAVHTHHRKLRSQGGDNSPENTVRLGLGCHVWVHGNVKDAYETGWLVKSWDDPATVKAIPIQSMQRDIFGAEIPHDEVVSVKASSEPLPGTECSLCKRRVPHPKKPSSPKSKPLAYRVPEGDYEAHVETIDAVAELLGITESKYHRFNTVNAGLLALLQGARLEEVGG